MNKNTKDFSLLESKIKDLNSHKLFRTSNNFSKKELKIFMEYHVYAVWDFMSIVKSLQNHICPSNFPWKPHEYTNNGIAHLINEIVSSEESDLDEDGNYFSHFDLYIMAMNDVGADTKSILKLIKSYDYNNANNFIDNPDAPKESLEFIENTFSCIESKKLANITAIFSYGRETTIPDMFSKILNKIDDSNSLYSNLRLYINRHIEVDSSRHGPLSKKLFEYTYKNNQETYDEAINYAIKSIDKRIQLWDGVLKKISNL